jgi:hypothetical protein
MTIDTYIRAQMVRFAMEEAQRYGGANNMIAMCQVLRNRVFAGWGDWLEVVMTAPMKRGNRGNGTTTPFALLRTPEAAILLNRIEEIYTRVDTSDMTGGALFYIDSTQPVNDWFEKEVLKRPEEHARTAHIGPVWFFK